MEVIMKKFVLIFIILFSFLCLWGVIESAPGGGYWNNENSWIGYIVPGPNDDVLIASNIDIDVDATCHNLTISSSGLIQNSSGSNRLLTINGNLSNAGLIRNYTGGSYFLDIAVYGDLNNIGNIQNRKISFYGNENQYFSNTGSLSPVYITDENSLSSLILLSDLYLQNTIFDLNNSTLIMNGPDGTFNLSMDGGYMTDAVLEGGNGATFSMTGGSYLENISANEIAFAGTVIVKNDVSINNLVNQGTIMNASGSNYTLTVSQSLTNYGNIQDVGYDRLYINLGGDLYNYGNITNRYITLFNQVQHQLLVDNVIHPIACNYFTIADAGVNCKALFNLYFTNCSLNLNGGTLSLTNEYQSFGLYLDGGYLSYATLDGGTESILNLTNNAYLSSVTMDNLIWQGTVIVKNDVSINNLVNQGTIMNASGSNYTLTVSQSLTNYGNIQDVGYDRLYINLGGDLYNYGNITNRYITLFNQVQHQLLVDNVIHPIACNYFTIADAGVNCKALFNLYFTNCSLNLNGGTLSLTNEYQSFGLYLDGGYLSYATLDGGTESILNLTNNAYLSSVTMDNLIWQGTVIVKNDVSINNLVNQGTIMNASGSNYTLTVSQSLTNYGTIQDIGYNKLDINLGGDLYNYSIIQNRRIYLNGFQDQYVLNVGTISVPYFYAAANIGAAFWYFNGILPVGSSLQSDKSINPNEPGVWHPYNPETGQNGRYIIVSNNNQALATPSNLSISLANGIPKLSWNKVNGALYYNIYTAPTPEGPYTLLGKAFNFNSYNDIIEFNINDPQPLQFFRVTTGN